MNFKKIAGVTLALAALTLTGCSSTASSVARPVDPAVTNPAVPSAAPSAPAIATPTPNPSDGYFTSEGTCDYLLSFDSNFNSTSRFVGTMFLTNEGSVTIPVKVTVQWNQSGGRPIIESKTVQLKPNAQNVQVNFSHYASSDAISAIQALPSDKECTIVTDGTTIPSAAGATA